MPDRGSTPDVWSRGDELARWLHESTGLVVGIDFDGTLTPIVDDHSAPVITAPSREAVQKLVGDPQVVVAVVSGRSLDDLVERVGVDDVVYAGNHGLEFAQGGFAAVHPEAAANRSRIQRLVEKLRPRLHDVSDCTVENKGVTATVHYRRVPDETVDAVVSTVEAVVSAADVDVRVVAGKQALEVRPAVDWDKGAAIRLLTDASPPGWRPVYVGDDATDEDAFEAVEPDGAGIRVGPGAAQGTSATYRLPAREGVPAMLSWMAESMGVSGTAVSPAGQSTPSKLFGGWTGNDADASPGLFEDWQTGRDANDR